MRRVRASGRRSATAVIGIVAVLFMFSAGLALVRRDDASAAPGPISGRAFEDQNANGAYDSAFEVGVAGVAVTVTDGTGAVVGTTTSGTDGTYNLTPSANGPYRVEFSGGAPLTPGPQGSGAGSSVQFVGASGATNVNYALIDGYSYASDPAKVQLATVSQLYAKNAAADTATVYSFANSVAVPPTAASTTPSANVEGTILGTEGETGTTFGTAWNQVAKTLYVSALEKRHTDFGPGGPSAIYAVGLDPATGAQTSAPTVFTTLDSVFGANTAGDPALLHDPADWFRDAPAFTQVGKASLGGIEVSGDGRWLYVVNLFDRRIYQIPTANPSAMFRYDAPEAACAGGPDDSRPMALGRLQGRLFVGVTCTGETNNSAADLSLHVFAFTPPAAGGAGATLAAPVYTEVLTHDPLAPGDHYKPWHFWADQVNELFDASTSWGNNATSTSWRNPTPWLSDIEFVANGSGYDMVLAIRDRFSDQLGRRAGMPTAADDAIIQAAAGNPGAIQFETRSSGDVYRACFAGTNSWLLESGSTTVPGCATSFGPTSPQDSADGGPGGKSFYVGDDQVGLAHPETMSGGLAVVPGGDLVATAYNPASGDANTPSIYWLSNTAGGMTGWYHILGGPSDLPSKGQFGKQNGLGDLSLLTVPAPIEVGNRVWVDANSNGQQDAGEAPLAGVSVVLHGPGGQTATATTGANGNYVFSSATVGEWGRASTSSFVYGLSWLTPNTTGFSITVDLTQSAISTPGYSVTPADKGSDTTDSDATVSGTTGTITFATAAPGADNHTYDIGVSLAPPPPPPMRIGNLVFRDVNDNGVYEPGSGETPLAGVQVDLWRDVDGNGAFSPTGGDSTGLLASTVTDANGKYWFTGLNDGDYFVAIPQTVTAPGASATALTGLRSSTPTSSSPTVDNDDNGTPITGYHAVSMVLHLSQAATDPLNEALPGAAAGSDETEANTKTATYADADSNLTVDFGFAQPLRVGNLVWRDQASGTPANDNNGVADPGEQLIAGVKVEVYKDDGDGVFEPGTGDVLAGTSTTGGTGNWYVSGLAPGDYWAAIPGGQAPLNGLVSSSGRATTDPDDGIDDVDDGDPSGTFASVSKAFTLAYGTEPTNENGDLGSPTAGAAEAAANTASGTIADNNSNLTVDFGFRSVPTGAITVTKTVAGDAGSRPANWSFTLASSNCTLPGGLTNPVTIAAAGGTATWSNLPADDGSGVACSYTVTEASVAGWTTTVAPAGPYTVTGAGTTNVGFTNTLQTGTIKVDKTVSGSTAGLSAPWSFTLASSNCTLPAGLTNPATVPVVGGSASWAGLPVKSPTGADCAYTVTEAAVAGWTASFSPAGPYTVAAGATTTVAVTNTFQTGSVRVTKTVSGDAGSRPANWSFTLSSSNCTLPGGLTNPVTVPAAGGTATWAGLATTTSGGANCTYTVAEAAVAGWTAVITPSTPVTVTAGNTTDVAVTNTLQTGTLEVDKTVSGSTAGLSAPWSFTLASSNCVLPSGLTNPATVPVVGGSASWAGLPVKSPTGADCSYTVAEAAVAGWAASFSPAGPYTVTAGATTTVAVTNTFQTGSVRVTKTVSGDAGSRPANWSFTVASSDCTLPGGLTNPVTVPAAGGTATWAGLATTTPGGADCTYTVTEAAVPGWVATLSPSTPVTVTADNTTDVAVTNTLQTGTVRVTKTLAGSATHASAPWSFTLASSNCVLPSGLTNPASVPVAGGQASWSGLPVKNPTSGADCAYSVTEAPVSGWSSSVSPASVTLSAGATSDVAVTNAVDPGSVRVTKTVSGDAGSRPANWSFTLSSSNCTLPGGLTNPVTIAAAGGTATWSGLPVDADDGSLCQYSVAEASVPGWTAALTPSTPVTLDPGATTDVAVTNTLQTGTLEVDKTVTPVIKTPVPWTFTLASSNCTLPAGLTNPATVPVVGGSASWAGLPVKNPTGADCSYTVTEAAVAGWIGTFTPAGPYTVTAGATTTVAVANTETPVYDLSLVKVVDGTDPSPVQLGTAVPYRIRVRNQGNTPAIFGVRDWVPEGMAYVPGSIGSSVGSTGIAVTTDVTHAPGVTTTCVLPDCSDAKLSGGGGYVDWTVGSAARQLQPGEEVELTLSLRVFTFDGTTGAITSYVNTSEIISDNSSSYGILDEDSTPDTDPANDPVVDGTQLNDVRTIDDGRPSDEDDHDIAVVSATPEFDLALRKAPSPGQPTVVHAGETVKFTITVFNQGDRRASDVHVVDYLPPASELVYATATNAAAGWVDNGNGTASIGIGDLAVGASRHVEIAFTVPAGSNGQATNVAEISSAKDDTGANPPDRDSTPDTNPSDDGTPVDDEINQKPPVDEDDHDPASVVVDTLTLGNRVWLDVNGNGLQDPGEAGIDGVTVELYRAGADGAPTGTALATTTTAGGGYYLFTGISYAGDYVVVVPSSNFAAGNPLVHLYSSPGSAPAGTDVDRDDSGVDPASDTAAVVSTPVTLAFDNEPVGEPDKQAGVDVPEDDNSNVTVDFGFTGLSLGNRVFVDINANGVQDLGEPGVGGVTVELWPVAGGSAPIATTTTSATGFYRFDGLHPGTYVVRLPAGNFTGTGSLVGYISTEGDDTSVGDQVDVPPSSDNDVDRDDNGAGPAAGPVDSTPVTLAYAAEPAGETDLSGPADARPSDVNADMTVDFGFVVTPPLTLGNRVWLDRDNDGQQDPDEPGIAKVVVELYADRDRDGKPDSTTPIQQTVTDDKGYYRFTGLTEGTYLVAVPASNWDAGGALVHLASSVGASTSADDDVDLVDDGVDPATAKDTVWSTAVTLSFYDEPKGETDLRDAADSAPTDDNANVTADFGFYPLAAIGDRVWLDDNKNGVQDPGEKPVSGVVVVLCDANGHELARTTTDADGLYLFDDLVPGEYRICFDLSTLPRHYVPVQPDRGADDAADSDADVRIGSTVVTRLDPGERDLTWDLGIRKAEVDEQIVKTVERKDRTLVWTLRVTNLGPDRDDGPIQLDDHLPAMLTFVSVESGSWSCTVSGQHVHCVDEDGMLVNETSQVRITTTVQGTGYVTNEASVLSETTERTVTNNTSAASIEVVQSLAFTGRDVMRTVVLAAGTTLVGLALVMVGRRRRRTA